MTISIKKLEVFFSKNGMVAKNFYVTNKMTCIFIEILIVNNLESFMVYVAPELNVKIDYGSNVFLINSVPINDNGDLFEQYTNPIFASKVEVKYDEIDLQSVGVCKNNDVEKHYENRYNKPIMINAKFVNKDLFRQIRRLSLCIPQPYKIILMMGNNLYVIKKDNKIRLYLLGANDAFTKDKYKRTFVVIDLPSFYEKIKNINDDVNHIKFNILSLLRKNFLKHLEEIVTNNSNKTKLEQKKIEILEKEEEYLRRIAELDKMLNELLENERQILDKKTRLDEQLNLAVNGINKDIDKLKLARQHEIKLFELNDAKKELTVNILSLKIKYDHLILFADSFSFELVVMSECINNRISNIEI